VTPDAGRDRLLALLGRLPARVPQPPPAATRHFVLDGIEIETWILYGPREPIPALFLVASGAPKPAPALLALHPHGRQYETGKSLVAGLVGDGSRAYALEAARSGFAVLAPDLMGFEDRRPPLPVRKSSYALQGEGFERTLAMRALAEGSTLQGLILSDLSACIDALELEPRADVTRLASIGQSFGGQETIFAMLFEPRLRAGIASCGFSLMEILLERSISHNFALYLPGMVPGFDFDAIVAALAPKPLFVVAGIRDPIYPVDGVRRVEECARAAYAAAGAPDSLRFHYFDGTHDLPREALLEALAWLKEITQEEAAPLRTPSS